MGTAALEGVSIDGKVYAMPLDTQPEGIYYSKDLFEKARHHLAADDDGRARGRRRETEGDRRRADRGRRQGRLVRPRTGTTTSPCASAARRSCRRPPGRSRSTTRAGPGPARTWRRSWRPPPSRRAS
ncbi:hypothetical protein LUW77_04895 [Streptomyces radiopugnans]|nr:hypothetical protein LUW77_04895 [Streptomyces radiopugnans]